MCSGGSLAERDARSDPNMATCHTQRRCLSTLSVSAGDVAGFNVNVADRKCFSSPFIESILTFAIICLCV